MALIIKDMQPGAWKFLSDARLTARWKRFFGKRERLRRSGACPKTQMRPVKRGALGVQISFRSADFQVCRVADFQIGPPRKVIAGAGLEACGTADLEVCATAKGPDKSCSAPPASPVRHQSFHAGFDLSTISKPRQTAIVFQKLRRGW